MSFSIRLTVVFALLSAGCPPNSPSNTPSSVPTANSNQAAPTSAAPADNGADVALASMCTDDPPEAQPDNSAPDAGSDATDPAPSDSTTGGGSASGDDSDDDDSDDDDDTNTDPSSDRALRQLLATCKTGLKALPSIRWTVRKTGVWHSLVKTAEWQTLRLDAQAFNTCRWVRQPGAHCGPLRSKMRQDRIAVRNTPEFAQLEGAAAWQTLKQRAGSMAKQGCFNIPIKIK